MIAEILSSCQKFFNRENVEVQNKVEKFCLVHADKDRLYRVLNHLISNSFKFTLDGYIKVSVQDISVDNKQFVKFCIEDSGCGMD